MNSVKCTAHKHSVQSEFDTPRIVQVQTQRRDLINDWSTCWIRTTCVLRTKCVAFRPLPGSSKPDW